MNKSHKSIWNESLGTYVAAAETANATGRKTSSGRKARRVPLRAHAGQLALEQRIVFDAALPATLAEAQAESAAGQDPVLAELDQLEAEDAEVDAAAVQAEMESTEPVSDESEAAAAVDEDEAETGEAVDVAETGSEAAIDESLEAPVADEPLEGVTETEMVEAVETERVEIIFVDSVAGDLTPYLGIHNGEVYVLDADRDGVAQMAEVLKGRSGIDAVHILSHGTSGRIQLGSASLDATSIVEEHTDEMAVIAAALSADADILIYGCDVGSGSAGVDFVSALALATGADVAASMDATGSEAQGGDWVLESQQGQIDATNLAVTAWSGLLAQNNTGTWTLAGSGSTTVATNTTVGVVTTVSFSAFTNTANVNTVSGSAALNNLSSVFSPDGTIQNTTSLGFTYAWDAAPEAGNVLASTDGGTGLMTITFSTPVTNPVIHLDRLGGSSNGLHNGLTLVLTSGQTLTRLDGTDHFAVTSTTVTNSQIGIATGTGFSAESSTNINTGTAAGSVRVNGTNITSITFRMEANAASLEGTGADAIELKVSFDPGPTARNDAYTVAEDTQLNGNLLANNGSGADSDPNGDALTVTQINGAAVTVGAPVALANGVFTLNNATTGAFTFVPASNFVGTQTFTYTISDPNGSTSTATDTITVTPANDPPVAIDDAITVTEDTPFTSIVDLDANDTDLDG
ncbi:MAG TPA: hypothetical protein DCY64_06815, partial [Hydrogenophaga sp.]|uniref:DUF4347 domain-containing protein n=1 Tax=Hydrogenophaga sp. TaxID=1904254 RepID=UPI000E8BD5A1